MSRSEEVQGIGIERIEWVVAIVLARSPLGCFLVVFC